MDEVVAMDMLQEEVVAVVKTQVNKDDAYVYTLQPKQPHFWALLGNS